MRAAELVKRVGQIQETLNRGQENETETLRAVKSQVDSLEIWIQRNCADSHTGCLQTEGKTERIPDEDSADSWRVCSCNQVACMTCEAERQASASATQWFDSQKPQSPQDVESKRDKDHWNRVSKCLNNDVTTWYAPCIVDETFHITNTTFKYVLLLHPHLSAAGTTQTPKNRNACGLIALAFAQNILRASPEPNIHIVIEYNPVCSMLTRPTYEAVRNAIKDGNDVFAANFRDETDVKLDPEYTVLINSHLGVSLVEQMTVDPNKVVANLTDSILKLEKGHILLFFRMEDYKVLSVINYRSSRNMVIFDGQLHTTVDTDTDEEIEYGGIICQIAKDYYTIFQTLMLLELHGGKFKGVCKVAIVKLDT